MCASLVHETADRVARGLEQLLPDDVRADLASEDTVTAVELHFPEVEVRPLLSGLHPSDECSVDGFYDANLSPPRRFIFVVPSVSEARRRFTILHELGHHLLQTSAAHFLDAIDAAAVGGQTPMSIEESVCHRFAARILVPDGTLDEVVDLPLRPAGVVSAHNVANASWEAVAIRVSERLQSAGAIVLLREERTVSFCASARLSPAWWPRGSATDPKGALIRAFDRDQRARKDTYRYGLSFARELYCDTLRVHDHLAIGVMSDRPSDGSFDILVDPEPSWRRRMEFCEWCEGERTVGWCDRCRGRLCRDCGRCGCKSPVRNPVCPKCFLENPIPEGESVCVDCLGLAR